MEQGSGGNEQVAGGLARPPGLSSCAQSKTPRVGTFALGGGGHEWVLSTDLTPLLRREGSRLFCFFFLFFFF